MVYIVTYQQQKKHTHTHTFQLNILCLKFVKIYIFILSLKLLWELNKNFLKNYLFVNKKLFARISLIFFI